MTQQLSINKRSSWLYFLLVICFVLAYFPVWKGLVMAWYGSDDYSHGFFIVPISIYAIWKKRDQLSVLPIRSSRIGFVLLLLSLFFYVMASYAEIKTVASLAMIVSLFGIIWYLYGISMLRETFYPLFFLMFMIPVPAQIYSALTIPLQLFVTHSSVWLSSAAGLPIFGQGNIIHLPEHTLEVVQACSGLRSLMSLLALSIIIAYFSLKSNILRIIVFFGGILAAIVGNIIRVLLMVLAFYYFDFDLTQGAIHTLFGMAIFMVAIAMVFGVRGVVACWDKQVTEK